MASIKKRKDKNGEIRYHVQVRLKGHPSQYATFRRETDAKKWVQQTEVAIREGRHFKTNEAKKHTLAEMIDRYIKTIFSIKEKALKADDDHGKLPSFEDHLNGFSIDGYIIDKSEWNEGFATLD